MPRQRITKEFLLDRAYALVKERGIAALSAKSLAQAARCSVQPIYSYYTNMDELKDQIYQKAGNEYRDFINERKLHTVDSNRNTAEGECAAVSFGIAHILFASRFPHLFFLLFQQTQFDVLETMLPHFTEGQFCLEELEYRMREVFLKEEEEAVQGFLLFVHGTACALHSGLVRVDAGRLETFVKAQYRRLTGRTANLGSAYRQKENTGQGKEKLGETESASYGWFRGFRGTR